MYITTDKINNTITINTGNTSYQMQIDRCGYLLHLYYGKRLAEGECRDDVLIYKDRGFSGNPYDMRADRTYSLDALPQEFPVQGTGDFRSVLLSVKNSAGVYGCDLRYASHVIRKGKYSLPGLPSVYSDSVDDEAETLEVVLRSADPALEVHLLYGVLPHIDVITRSAVVINTGNERITIERAGSANLDFTAGDYDMMVFAGRHGMERVPYRSRVSHGTHMIGSRRGMSSHQYNPLLILSERDTDEDSGACWAMQFAYSGGFFALAERDGYDQTRMQMGLSTEKFDYPLEGGGKFVIPEVIMSCSLVGFTGLSHNLHDCIRRHICRSRFRDAARPVLINSWEAFYMDFNGEKILRMADEAKALGIEMVVMDDGWFGNRFDDNRSLGDWAPNESKLGCALGELVEKVHNKRMKFGIWMEPECVSEDSDLYREHPDWALVVPGRKPVMSRNQLVLDLSRAEVVEYLYECIRSVLDAGVDYMKWDVNRSIADVYSHTTDQGSVMYDYVLGLYDLMERINSDYPDLLLESCSGGGGRFDAGMLYYSPQIWCSDNTDPIDRALIQYGTSFGYPACVVGAHVSASPNEMTGRVTPLETRAAVAMAGTFGYELDPATFDEDEKAAICAQIDAFKADNELVRTGRYYRLSSLCRDASGDDCDSFAAWAFVSEEGDKAIINAVSLIDGTMRCNVPVKGLCREREYRIRETGSIISGGELCESGITIEGLGAFESRTFHLERV